MQLTTVAKKNLEFIKSSNLTDENFNKLLLDCISIIINKKHDDKSLMLKSSNSDVKPEIIKAAYIDLTSIIVEAVRQGYDHKNLFQFLCTTEVLSTSKLERLCDVYRKNYDSLRSQLINIGDCYPCLKDVSWRLDYCIKTSENYSFHECIYYINLTTKKNGVLSNVQFTCSIYQLQELVHKLKDIVRHLEKLSSQ
ncbi:COMM domain-containing protein 3 [Chelonus insularis]|uniref:COMM domain-containing protein 3 n=1 Tax=Chelonus insularis TaxID=460826 RepID=UPI00158DCAA5|nr:COMM domain-containing protein 3-like [Chelonus insularis]